MDSGRKRVIASAAICSVLNIVLDFVSVSMHLGMFGIGLATAVAQYISVAYLFLHFLGKDRMLSFVPLATSAWEILQLLSLGTEKALRRVSSVIRPVIMNKLII